MNDFAAFESIWRTSENDGQVQAEQHAEPSNRTNGVASRAAPSAEQAASGLRSLVSASATASPSRPAFVNAPKRRLQM